MIGKRTRDCADRRLGILGGGQLASMLADAALRSGLRPLILVNSTHEPAAVAGHEVRVGRLDDAVALDAFLAEIDVLTIENEFLDLAVLGAALERRPGLELRPGLAALALAQDKLAQKRLFRRLDLPTAEFEILGEGPVADELARLAPRFPEGFVLKWSRFGYDGRGNLMIAGSESPDLDEVERFCAAGRAAGAEIYAERRVDFVAELAMVTARGLDGGLEHLPLVRTVQERGICREVVGPAATLGHDAGLETRARAVLAEIARELDFIGAFAIEFFLDREDKLLVNEMAPRVHNSGHYSLWLDDSSQFDLHVRAVVGLPLEGARPEGIVLMRNVLGPADLAPPAGRPRPSEEAPPGVALHWYGKDRAAPGRKMGHLTARAASLAEAEELLAAMAAWERRFWNEITNGEGRGHDGSIERARRHHHGVGVGSAGHEAGLGGPR